MHAWTHDASALVWPDVPERIERGLVSPDAASRRSAARELTNLSPERATPLVLKALADPDVDVRLAAAQAAVRLRVKGATERAIEWLGEREARLRASACEVAQAMPSPVAVQPAARAVSDSDQQVRTACADALGASGSPEAVTPLAGKLDDGTPQVRAQVARALARLGDTRAVVPLVGKVQDSVPEVRQAVVRALGDLGDPRATQALLLALRDNAPEVKVEALGSLGRLRATEAVDAIAPLASERNPAVKHAALVALGRIASPAAVRALVRGLGTQEDAVATTVRSPVRDALVAAGPAAIPELTALLERPVAPAVASSAAWVLGELRATSSAPTIVAALRRGTLPPGPALHALAGAGSPDQVPVVLEYVADPSPATREAALRAGSALLDPSHPDGRAVEPLAATLQNPRLGPDERAKVATLLGRTGAPRAATELAGLVGAKDTSLRLAAIDALGALGATSTVIDDALVPLLADTDPSVRLHTAVALAHSGGPKARGALLQKLGGGDELDRFALLTALGGVIERHPDDAAARRLFAELAVAAGAERDAVIEAAGRIRLPSIVHALAGAAKSTDADDRRSIAAVLAAHAGNAEAIATLRALTADGDPSVRAEAAFALGGAGDASIAFALLPLTRDGNGDIATNAVAALARLAARGGAPPTLPATACPLLADGRPGVRANALATLAILHARCADGRPERALLETDPSELVRAAAARVLVGATKPEDRATLDRCSASDRSTEVVRVCRPKVGGSGPRRPARPVTIFIAGESGTAPKPRAAFMLEYDGGVLRAGVADRRGATFDPIAPDGDVVLRRTPR